MKVRRVCVMMDADEASACLVALHRYTEAAARDGIEPTYDEAARRAFDLIASRSAGIRAGRLVP